MVHGELVKQVLESLLLLTEVAVVHINRHQKGGSMEAADKDSQMRLPNKLLWGKETDSLVGSQVVER